MEGYGTTQAGYGTTAVWCNGRRRKNQRLCSSPTAALISAGVEPLHAIVNDKRRRIPKGLWPLRRAMAPLGIHSSQPSLVDPRPTLLLPKRPDFSPMRPFGPKASTQTWVEPHSRQGTPNRPTPWLRWECHTRQGWHWHSTRCRGCHPGRPQTQTAGLLGQRRLHWRHLCPQCPSETNLHILEQAAICLKAIKGPWIAVGDWNIEPHLFTAADWLNIVGGVVHAPSQPTCHGHVYDFFVVHRAISLAIVGVQLLEDAGLRPSKECPSNRKLIGKLIGKT